MKKILFNSIRYIPFLALVAFTQALAQPAGPPLADGPWIFDTFEEDNVRLSILARGLDHPFGLVFLPGTASAEDALGDVIINERTGKVRLYRNGQLEEQELIDLVEPLSLSQLFDIKLHPQFSQNGLIYFTYIKDGQKPDGTDGYWSTTAIARAQFTGDEFINLEDVFVAEAWSQDIGGASSRMHFADDGTILFGLSHRLDPEAPQLLDNHMGKTLRLNDDGSVPQDNPYVGVEGALPEIYTFGNRSIMDFVTNPTTGEVWELENGPQGGDEINIIKPRVNYGWPLVSYGREYDGTLLNIRPWVEGTELATVFWVPSITVSSMEFYTGDKFPNWQGSLFVSSMVTGRVPGTGHIERVVFNEFGEIRREQLLNDLHQRMRYIVQGPDGFLYILTDDANGTFLRMEPNGTNVSNADGLLDLNETVAFANNDCRSCHQTDAPLVGPSYADIAKRYSLNDSNVALLVEKIIQGGGGAWGEVPMAPHAGMQEGMARELATQILGLGTN